MDMLRKTLSMAVTVMVMVAAISCGNRAGKYSGEWAEKSAERIVATFTPIGEDYKVSIGWREEGLAQYEVWEMTATKEGDGSLSYKEGSYKIRRYEHQGDKEYTEETVYSDGTGSFRLNKDGELSWKDGKEPEQEETLFIRADFTKE